MRKIMLLLAMVTLSLSSNAQVKSRISTRTGVVNQIKAFGRVSYQGLDYYPVGKDSLLVKGEMLQKDSVIIPEVLTIDNKPYKVTGFKPSAFEYNVNIKYVSMPKSIIEIESSAFNGCSRLKECDMPNVRYIGAYSFVCTDFEKIVFPDSLEYISDNVFSQCSDLIYIELPKNLKRIGDDAFLTCDNLKTVKVHFTEPIELGSGVFHRVRRNYPIKKITLMVPAGSKKAFEEADGWKYFNPIVEY